MNRARILVIAAVVVLALPAGPALASERPIEGTGGGFYGEDGSNTYLQLLGETDHLGRSAVRIYLDPDAILQEGRLVPIGPFFSLISASGDVLVAKLVDFQDDPAAGVLRVSMEFVGGTGRFADAAGTADLLIVVTGWQNPGTPPSLTWLLDGIIDY